MVLGMIIGAATWSSVFNHQSGTGAFVWPAGESRNKKTTALLLKSVETGLRLYNDDMGHYPSAHVFGRPGAEEEEGGLEALRVKPNFSDRKIAEKWNGPYLEEEPRDAWGNKLNYQLTLPGTPEYQQTPYKLWSNGPDGMDGTADDINNWSSEGATN
jgi:general secretion pathway protein G